MPSSWGNLIPLPAAARKGKLRKEREALTEPIRFRMEPEVFRTMCKIIQKGIDPRFEIQSDLLRYAVQQLVQQIMDDHPDEQDSFTEFAFYLERQEMENIYAEMEGKQAFVRDLDNKLRSVTRGSKAEKLIRDRAEHMTHTLKDEELVGAIRELLNRG